MDTPTTEFGPDLDDRALGRALAWGTAIGIPVIYALTVAVSLVAGATLARALAISVWPALVGGPFFGALALLGQFAERHREPAVVIPLRPAVATRRHKAA